MDMPMDKSRPLKFFELGWDRFQRLCRALFEELDGVHSARVYGRNGQAQSGIDILVTLDNGKLWGVQCKACEKDEKTRLTEAFEAFNPFVDEWKQKGMTHFYVVLGCAIEDTKASDLIPVYKSKFSTLGLEFEVWDSHDLRKKCLDLTNRSNLNESNSGLGSLMLRIAGSGGGRA